MVAFGKAFSHALTSRIQRHVTLLSTSQTGMHVVEGMFQVHQPGFSGIGNRLCGGARLRRSRLVARKRVTMNQSMSGCTTLDLSQANQVTSFEVAVPMLKFPKRRVWRTCMKYIAHCDSSQRTLHMVETGDIPLWNPYIFNCRTNEEIFVCLKYCLLGRQRSRKNRKKGDTNDKTFENSEVGDMTKLSLVLDHEMRC